MSYTFQIQMQRPDDGDAVLWKGEEWLTLGGFQSVGREYALGWCEGRRDGVLPCPGLRVIRVSLPNYVFDKVVREFTKSNELRAGMMPAGYGFQWPYILRAVELGLEYAQRDASSMRGLRHEDNGPPVTDIGEALEAVRAIRENFR